MEEVETAKRRARGAGGLNTIVMNAVLEACVRCGDVDLALRLFVDMRRPRGCGVDGVSYGILLKGLGIARRIDDAFEILESIEKDTSIGSPRISPHLICGFLNALIEAGDMRRANALVARFCQVLYEGHSVLLYNLLMKAGNNKGLRPKPHLYLSIMRAFATIGDLDMVKRLNKRMWPDSVGSISRSSKEEADELLI